MTRSLLWFSAAAFVAIAAAPYGATPGRAEIEYPWCSMTSTSQSGLPVCLYSTLEQCQAFIAGQAGSCQQNSRVVARVQAAKRGAR